MRGGGEDCGGFGGWINGGEGTVGALFLVEGFSFVVGEVDGIGFIFFIFLLKVLSYTLYPRRYESNSS